MSLPLQNINTYTYSPGFQLGQYHNAVLCISGNVQNLYLDGNLIATKTATTNILANYSNINQILIGCAGDKSSGFSGYLDDFRMYNYTLNETQVSNLYINRNIVAYYPFDNSLNGQTPNYVTLAYDASFVGNAATISTISSNFVMGNGALQLTNTTTVGSIKSYVTSSSGFSTSATNGISVSLWFKASGVSARRMRLFDLCKAFGAQGISVDISGTNQIVTGYSVLLVNAPTINAVSYPDSTSATIYFTPSTTSEVSDYQYSFDNITYTSIGIPKNSFTVNNLTGINTLYLIAVKYGTVSSPSTFSINPSYTARATIGGIGSGKILMTPSYEYYVFTNTAATSTLTFANATNIEYVLIAAGGNGGSSSGGGGGAGGVLSNTASDITNININVGNPSTAGTALPGGDTIITLNSTNTITAKGGGAGGANTPGGLGGSGGGGSAWVTDVSGAGIPGQGYNGGRGYVVTNAVGGSGGGGGAGGVGGNSIPNFPTPTYGIGGVGGAGTSAYSDWIIAISRYMNIVADISWSIYTISNNIGYIASGGAGGAGSFAGTYFGNTSRTIGGGGDGASAYANALGVNKKAPTRGVPNTGGGSGGCGGNGSGPAPVQGGSGIVLIRTPIVSKQLYTNLPLFSKSVSVATTITSVSDLGMNPQTINIVVGTGNGVAYQPGNSYTSTNLGKLYPVFFDSYNENTANNINFNFINQSVFTISLWVLIGVPSYDLSNFFRINNGTSDVLVMNASNNTNNMSLSTSGLTITTPYIKNSVNYHIVFTVNKTSGIILYKNGESVGSANGTITFTGSTFTAFLQGYGQIFNFKYYNYILTPTEITALYNAEV